MKIPVVSVVLSSTLFLCMCGNPKEEPFVAAPDNTREKPVAPKQEKISSIAITDLKEGPNLVRYENGVKKYEGEVKNGKREGKWSYWYNNGTPWSECEYREGKKEGKTVVWYENGNRRYEGSYKNDERSGKWSFWDEKGKLVKELSY